MSRIVVTLEQNEWGFPTLKGVEETQRQCGIQSQSNGDSNMFLRIQSSILRHRLFASALLLLSLGSGAWLWTRTSQKAEISGKGIETGPEKTQGLKLVSTPAGTPGGESREDRATRLLQEAHDLVRSEQFEDLTRKDYTESSAIEELRHNPVFQRWREIVKELIEIGQLPQVIESEAQSDVLGYSIDFFSGLLEANDVYLNDVYPEALLDAFKFNRLLSIGNSFSQEGCLRSLLAKTLGQQSPEALRDYSQILQESSAMLSRDFAAEMKFNCETSRKYGNYFFARDWYWCQASEHYKTVRDEVELFFQDAAQMQNLQPMFQDLEAKCCQTLEQSSNWPQRLQALQDFQDSLHQGLEARVPEGVRGYIVDMLCPVHELYFKASVDDEAERQGVLAALQVEQFRREQGRLPVSLEEVGWVPSTEDPIKLSYEVKDGKAVLKAPIIYRGHLYGRGDAHGCKPITHQQEPFEVKW
jgi:hypothetical protein